MTRKCHSSRRHAPSTRHACLVLARASFLALLALSGGGCRREPPARLSPLDPGGPGSAPTGVLSATAIPAAPPVHADVAALQRVLPQAIDTIRRRTLLGETNAVVPYAIAKAVYETSGGPRVEITLSDMGAAPDGLASIRGLDWLAVQRERESLTDYETIWTYAGYKVYEKFNRPSRMGVIRSLFANRFLVEVEGIDAAPSILTNAFRQIRLYELRGLTAAPPPSAAAGRGDRSFPATRSLP